MTDTDPKQQGLEQAALFAYLMGTGIESIESVVFYDEESSKNYGGQVSTYSNGLFYVSRGNIHPEQQKKQLSPKLKQFDVSLEEEGLKLSRHLSVYPPFVIKDFSFNNRRQVISFNENDGKIFIGDYFHTHDGENQGMTYGLEYLLHRTAFWYDPGLQFSFFIKHPNESAARCHNYAIETRVNRKKTFHNFMSGEGNPLILSEK